MKWNKRNKQKRLKKIDFRGKKYNQILKFTGWVQQKNRNDKGKSIWRQINRNYLIWTTEKKNKVKEQSFRDSIKRSNILATRVSKGEEKSVPCWGQKKVEETMAENFPNLAKDINLYF